MSEEIKTAPATETTLEKVENSVKKFNWAQIGSFWEESPGSYSMTRLLTFLIISVPLVCWLFLSVYHLALQEMPSTILGLQTAGLAAKAVAKSQENKSNS